MVFSLMLLSAFLLQLSCRLIVHIARTLLLECITKRLQEHQGNGGCQNREDTVDNFEKIPHDNLLYENVRKCQRQCNYSSNYSLKDIDEHACGMICKQLQYRFLRLYAFICDIFFGITEYQDVKGDHYSSRCKQNHSIDGGKDGINC